MIYTKASGVNNSVFGKSQEPIRMMLEGYEESFQAQSQIDNIFTVMDTKNFAEKFTSHTTLGTFKPVGENGAYPKAGMQEGYSRVVEPEEWKLQFQISKTMLEDGKLGPALKEKGSSFMLAYHRTREMFGAALLSGAVATTINFGDKVFNIAGADGKALFATDHPSITNGYAAQSNIYNAEFSYDNLSYAEEKMQKFRDDDGNLLAIRPDTIIIPNNAAIKKLVFEVLNAEGKPGGNNNDGNFQFGRWNVIVWDYLANPSTVTAGKDWWLLMDSKLKDSVSAFPWLDRVKLSVHSWVDENNDANVFNGRARFGAAPNNWRAFLACTPGVGSSLT